jgi:hypothetical protein
MGRINWRSLGAAFFAAVTMLAALPYTLGDLATVIPPAAKPWVAGISLVAAFILRSINSIKSKSKE